MVEGVGSQSVSSGLRRFNPPFLLLLSWSLHSWPVLLFQFRGSAYNAEETKTRVTVKL